MLATRTALISGASQGFGFAIAKEFLFQGANIALCARDYQKLEEAKNILSAYQLPGKIFIRATDVANPQQVTDLMSATLAEFGNIDILVANAGVHGTKGPIEEVDWDEWSQAIDINLKGTVLQCRAVLPQFKKQKSGKIIILSGGGATKPMPYLSAYAASKAGVVRFAETLAEEVRDFNIDVNTVAPGALNTRLLDDILAAGPNNVGEDFYAQALKQQKTGGNSLEVGASLCAYLASKNSDGISGKLVSAVWDPWKNLQDYNEDLKQSDIYTLRRIVPEDRGKKWNTKS